MVLEEPQVFMDFMNCEIKLFLRPEIFLVIGEIFASKHDIQFET